MSKPGHPFYYEKYQTYEPVKDTYTFVKEQRAVDLFSTAMIAPFRFGMAILIPLGIVMSLLLGSVIAMIFGFSDWWIPTVIQPVDNLFEILIDAWWIWAAWAFFGRWAYLLFGPNIVSHVVFKTIVYLMVAIIVVAAISSILFGIGLAIRMFFTLFEKVFG